MPRSRQQGGEPITERSAEQPCQACRLPPEERKLHWFYSFSSTEKLFAHLARERVPTTEEFRRAIARWHADCQDAVSERLLAPERYAERTDHLRRWSLHASQVGDPDDMDSLADEMLSSKASGAVKIWTGVWRKSRGSGRLTRDELNDLVARTVNA